MALNDPTNSRYRYIAFKNTSNYRRYVQDEGNKALEPSMLNYSQDDIPTHGTYGALLFDPRWRMKREEILLRDHHSCVICKRTEDLQVHHRQYHFVVRKNNFKFPWEYDNTLLITLCEPCHKRGHNKYKVPTINI